MKGKQAKLTKDIIKACAECELPVGDILEVLNAITVEIIMHATDDVNEVEEMLKEQARRMGAYLASAFKTKN